jgi:endonuclease/exonuclease/phosphatase family metal-dependent hydrolase
MQGKSFQSNISDILLLQVKHHLLLISTQECLRPLAYSVFYSKMQEWEAKVMSELGPDYQLLTAESLGGTHLMLISHVSISHLVKNTQVSTVATGFFNFIPNKGAVCLQFELGKYKILTVGCHLAAGDENITERNDGISRILSGFNDEFNFVLLFGDFNYRIKGKPAEVAELIQLQERSVLIKKDQLIDQMRAGLICERFKEGEILFRPTYKIKLEGYDEKRVPSWTDRILFKTNEMMVEQKSYSSIPNNLSDHFPVFSQFLFYL